MPSVDIGRDTITGWDRKDTIDLSKVAGFATFAAVKAATARVGDATVITLGADDSITVEHIRSREFRAANFDLTDRIPDSLINAPLLRRLEADYRDVLTRSGRPASGLAGSSSAAVAQAEEVSEPRYTVYRRPYGWLTKTNWDPTFSGP